MKTDKAILIDGNGSERSRCVFRKDRGKAHKPDYQISEVSGRKSARL
jgi:hypothetical protein